MGMQTHLQGGKGPTAAQLTGYINDFAALGVEVAITEMDVRIPSNNVNAQALSGQAQSYKNVIAACKAAAKCVGVTIWDFTDKYSWGKSGAHFRSVPTDCFSAEHIQGRGVSIAVGFTVQEEDTDIQCHPRRVWC
jgi:GH35 family endo-1,4-beta-xylanase